MAGRKNDKFQFLSGAIKRPIIKIEYPHETRFQFLSGAIKRGQPLNGNQYTIMISIPKWCD